MSARLHNLRIAATVGMVFAAGAALTACQGDTSGKGSDGSDGTPKTSAVASADGGTATATATPDAATATPSATSDDGGTTATAKGTTTGTAATARCQTSNLGFTFGPDSGAQAVGSPGGIEVVLTNKGSGTCTLQGFPGLDIVSNKGTHWSLVRQARSAAKVTLKPGAAASFEITYLPYDANDSGGSAAFHAASILVTPPGETHSTTLKWDGFADVMDQSGATHPGTYVGPVVAGR
ncbi:DUF4232 domain-containing protein [Streptomyces cocklensis]|uniref:DUF4232 domain-containing protein n=1 Tax=Actinacidiphila cocklensis TaxID=887465 RepID=A0A9W4DYQ6_9ACTN|nr:DUF4232 domain-containing protein [Actinacidiphila cocklensis]MDD1064181.1 DUF4232 domain-containing protein [Actinacidiphila cocklensis]WSX75559.1 DUF4232 domain-containing protein [Streptomyces sp. NBC_00899]CAG6398601.1 conserved exported hypothetical protein [Actinacidiphila cocklensis]